MKCPFPYYWICHIVIALAIAAVVWPVLGLAAGLLAGSMFYAGREVVQYQILKRMDWPGFLAPVGACVVVFIVSKVIML